MFGWAASVNRYNNLSQLFLSLVRRLLGLPQLGYFDDFSTRAETKEDEAKRDRKAGDRGWEGTGVQ